ncbi:MAG: hypothetical protein H7A25_12305 [Leptospiraceae bacterium]|nr:hypothetical protein [Leptospiraceae bacterium]
MKLINFFRDALLTEEKYEIDGTVPSEIKGKQGTILKIPAKAFIDDKGNDYSGKVVITLMEAVDDIDLLYSGLGLKYYDVIGREYFLEAKGILKLFFKSPDGSKLELKKPHQIELVFPGDYPGNYFKLYYMNETGRWMESTSSLNHKYRHRRLFAHQSGTYTRAKVIREIACLKGNIKMPNLTPNKQFQVFSLGLDYSSYFTVWVNKPYFEINVYRDKSAKILILDEEGNIGVSKLIKTPDKYGTARKKEGPGNFKMAIEDIEMKLAPKGLLTDRKKLVEFLEIKQKQEEKKEVKPETSKESAPKDLKKSGTDEKELPKTNN